MSKEEMNTTCEDCKFSACVGWHSYWCSKKDESISITDSPCNEFVDCHN